jgi:hypothetical protein
MYVEVYENGKLKELSGYSDLQLASLEKAIQTLFLTDPKSPYWFEVSTYEYCSCFRKDPPKMIVHCYTHDVTANGFKKGFPIPMKYRKKMFDTVHPIFPDPIVARAWPRMEVKFRLTK